MKRLILNLAAGVAAISAIPAQAATLVPGQTNGTFDPFVQASQGMVLATTSVPGIAFTFAATMRSAVYRNITGTLDFYYQVERTGPGSLGEDSEVKTFTAANFHGFTVDALVSAADVDGGGFFTMANNPGDFTSTAQRTPDGETLRTLFNVNGLVGTDTSATYIFRTNATEFTRGTFGVIDGSTFSGLAFAPTSAVPEPATWGLMLVGFGIVGSTLRRRRSQTAYAF